MKQDFFELIAARESCRNYDRGRPVEKAKIERCLQAARLAPSACNSQPWDLRAILRPALVKELGIALGQKFTEEAPAFIAVTEMKATLNPRIRDLVDSQYFAPMDIGIVATHLCLAATAQGLSTCILGWFDEEKIRRLLGIEEGRLRLVIAIGYAAPAALREKTRKELTEISAFVE